MRHYPKEIVWKRTISYFFAIFKGLTNKPIPTMNSYVSEAEYEEMMDAENAQFGELKAVPASALLTIDNETASNMLFLLMGKAQYLDLACRVKSGMAYYEFEDVNNVKRRLYLNSDIVDFVITYLMCGNKRSYYPKINNIDKNVDEAYILRLFKSDRVRNVGRYNTVSQEYKAVYRYGRINYGTFPYTTAEFDEKLNKLL